jgi:uncharacterized protein YdeI (YjbR/CyaY-like superfamily)
MNLDGDPRYFADPAAFRRWLEEHHATAGELWVGLAKKGTGIPSLTWPQSVDEALCFGWIDGVRKKVDEERYKIRFTPRRPGSTWSLKNVERFQELEAAGRVHAAGRAAFAARREERTGTYSFEREEPAELDPELQARLESDAAAWAFFQSQPPSHRRKVIHWVMSAKQQATRERRLEKAIAELRQSRRL